MLVKGASDDKIMHRIAESCEISKRRQLYSEVCDIYTGTFAIHSYRLPVLLRRDYGSEQYFRIEKRHMNFLMKIHISRSHTRNRSGSNSSGSSCSSDSGLSSNKVQSVITKYKMHNHIYTWMIPGGTLLAVAREAEAHQATVVKLTDIIEGQKWKCKNAS